MPACSPRPRPRLQAGESRRPRERWPIHPPRDWPSYTICDRYSDTTYRITVHNPGHGVREAGPIRTMVVDGVPQDDHAIPLVDDHQQHLIEIKLA